MREWWSKVAGALSAGRRLDEDLREEIESHLEFEIEERLSRGMTPEQARREARRNFGNPTLVHEQARESWTFRFVETFLQDLRHALRALARSPGFTITAVLSLAFGIGANSALFSVVDAVMLRVLPVRRPEQLIKLNWTSEDWPEKYVADVEGRVDRNPTNGLLTSPSFSHAVYEHLKANNGALSSLIASSSNDSRVNLGLSGRAEVAMMQAVSGDYFQSLGVAAVSGRILQPADDMPGAPPVAMISDALWRRYYGGNPEVAGRGIVINGTPATVVGVVPPGFYGIDPGRSPDLFVPLRFYLDEYRRIYDADLLRPQVWWLTLIGRLKPGETREQAGLELKALFRRYVDPETTSAPAASGPPSLEVTTASRGLDTLREGFAESLWLLMAMVALVLLIACANVAGLLLARAASRRKEISVRLSLGAPRLRIVRHLMTESLLLGLLGGAAGLLFAEWIASLIAGLFAGAQPYPVALSLRLNLRVFAFTAAVSIVSGIVFGLAPAWRAGRIDVYPALKLGPESGTRAGGRFLSGKILVGAQVALGLVLLVGAGLLVRTLLHLQNVELGFDPQRLLVFRVQPGLNRYKGDRLADYYKEMQRRIAAVPGVRSVGLSQRAPVGDGWSQGMVRIAGYTPEGERVPFYRHWVSPGFFETLGIPLILGRVIDEHDSSSAPPAVVVNQKFVRDYLRGDNPIGRLFDAGSLKAPIVGVVGDARYGNLRDGAPPTAYLSYLQYGRDCPASMSFEVRTDGDPAGIASLVRAEAATLDKDVPLVKMKTEGEVISQTLFLERTFAVLGGLFGMLALMLACVGLYGAMSYTVSRRRTEIGVRMALGAGRETILGMVLRETMAVVLSGIAIGLPFAWFGTRLLESRLFGVTAHDPFAMTTAVTIIIAVGFVAGLLPARQASGVDPVRALRCE